MRTSRSSLDRERGRRLTTALAASRRRRDLSQSSLALLAGVNLDTLRAVESGRVIAPSFLYVAAVCRVLNQSMDELGESALLDEA